GGDAPPGVRGPPRRPARARARRAGPRPLRRAGSVGARRRGAAPERSGRPRRDRARRRRRGSRRRVAPASPAVARRRVPRQDGAVARGRRRRGSRGARSGRARDEIGRLMIALADLAYRLGHRSVVRTIRQPANVIGPLIFPLLLLAVNAGGLRAETHLPGFPGGSMVAFLLAVPFIQGALFATMNTGTDLARDIQTGFLSRISLTPMRSVALLLGQLGGTVTLGLFQGTVYIAV